MGKLTWDLGDEQTSATLQADIKFALTLWHETDCDHAIVFILILIHLAT